MLSRALGLGVFVFISISVARLEKKKLKKVYQQETDTLWVTEQVRKDFSIDSHKFAMLKASYFVKKGLNLLDLSLCKLS